MSKRTAIIALAIVFAAGCSDSGGTSGPDPAPNAVTVSAALVGNQPSFVPGTVEVAVGGTVTWQMPAAAPAPHNVTSNTNAWTASPDLSAGQTFQVTFPQAGEFPYRCTIHSGMNGHIVVR